MKKIVLLVMLLVLGVIFAGCDVTYDIKKDDSVIITIECDDDDVEEYSDMLVKVYGDDVEFDEGDLDTKEDLEDILDDVIDEYDKLEGEVKVKSFKRDKNDDFTLVFEYVPNADIEDALNDGIAIGIAQEILDEFAEVEGYDDDFEDIYRKEFSDDVDDEVYYIFNGKGDELNDKEMEKYFDKAKLTKLKAAYILREDTDVYVPGKIELIISSDDDVDIDDDAISFDEYAIIVYKAGGNPLVTLLILALIAALGVGGYFAYDRFFAKKDTDDLEVDMDME